MSSIDKGSSIQTGDTDMERSALPVSTFGGRVQRVAELNKEGNAVQEVRSVYWCIFVAFLGACANGFDGSLMNAINGMQPYQDKFESGRLGPTTGIIFAIYTVGNMVGAFFSGSVADRWGRRFGMFLGGFIIIIGSVIITSSQKRGQFIGGRFILGFGIAFVTTAAPTFAIELAPPAWRGRAAGAYNLGWFGGSVPAAAITLGTSYMSTDWAWRLPLLCQCFPAVVLCLSVFFLPESPRWLIAQGRDDEARAILVKYHGNGNPANPLVELEWEEMKQDIAIDGSDSRWWDFSGLFKTRNARRRTSMMILMGVFGQFSGNGLGYFNLDIYAAVGYDSIMQFVLNLVNSITSAICAGLGVSIADRAPRRPILIYGTLICAGLLAVNAGLTRAWAFENPENHNLNVGRGAVAAYFLFNCVYSFAYTPLQGLYPVECLQTNARAKGMGMYAFIVSAVGFINTYAGPIALKNIKYNYVWIFVGWDVVESIVWYFFCIETQGRTLEELDEIFDAPRPVKASIAKKKVVVQDSGTVLVEK